VQRSAFAKTPAGAGDECDFTGHCLFLMLESEAVQAV
jgi:hypothetical protein